MLLPQLAPMALHPSLYSSKDTWMGNVPDFLLANIRLHLVFKGYMARPPHYSTPNGHLHEQGTT